MIKEVGKNELKQALDLVNQVFYEFGAVDYSEQGIKSLEDKGDTVFELRNLSVLPKYRNKRYGEQLLDFCKT